MTPTSGVSAQYLGASGEAYYLHRRLRRAPDVQRYSARTFQPYISPSDTVLDFGCGTGGILASVVCAHRIGVEINAASFVEAAAAGLAMHTDLGRVPARSVDVAISNHALEHVADPFTTVQHLLRVLKPGGALVVVVPCESPSARRFRTWRQWPDVHLYSWNPLSLGNLVTACGFEVKEAGVQPAGYSLFNRWLPPWPSAFRVAERVFASALGRYSTKCVARKPQ